MVRRSLRKNKLFQNKRVLYAVLIIGVIAVLGFGGSFLSAFGVESVWGADVEFNAIKFGDTLMGNVTDLPEYSFNVGSRTITINHDGLPQEEFDWDAADLYWGVGGITFADAGMKSKVNYDLGRFKYFDVFTTEVAEAVADIRINDVEGTADIHFYFGFSIGFSTAARSIPNEQGDFQMFIPGVDSDYAFYSEALVESGVVEMTSEVALRFSPITTAEYSYNGTVNEVVVLEQYDYYVTRPADYSGELDIATMNTNYDWNERDYYVPGKAEAVGMPEMLYNQIDSEGEEMAVVTASVKMNPAVDPSLIYGPTGAAQMGFEGYLGVHEMDVYNVGYIYDLLVDVSINDIPLTDAGAVDLGGRIGIAFAAKELPLYLNTDMVLLLAGILGFVSISYVISGRR